MKKALLSLFVCTIGFAFGQTNHTINSSGSTWSPNNLTIQVGDSVTWKNNGGTHNINGTTATFPSNPESFGDLNTGTGWTYGYRFNVAGTYNYRCDVHSGTMTGTLVVQATASIEEEQIRNFSIKPNPATNSVKIEQNFGDAEIYIYDLLGNVVIKQVMNNSLTLDVSEFNNGVYIVKIKAGDKSYTKRLVKK